MANELLKNSDGDAVPQKLADGSTLSAGDLTGDDTAWSIFKDPAQGGGSTLQDIVNQLQNGSFEIGSPVGLEADDSAGNGTQPLQRADGTRALKVANISTITAGDGNSILINGEDDAGNAVPVSVNAQGAVKVANANAEVYENGTSLSADNEIANVLSVEGAETFSGIVVRQTTSYDVVFRWADGPNPGPNPDQDNIIIEDVFAQDVAAGNLTTFEVTPPSSHVQVAVADAGGGTGTVSASFQLR